MFILFKHRGGEYEPPPGNVRFPYLYHNTTARFCKQNSQFTYYTQPGTFAKLKNIEKSQAVTINERRNRQACP